MNRDPESINTHTHIYIDWIDIITEMRSLSFFFCVGKFFFFVLFVGDSGHRQKKLVQTNALREYDDTFRFISKEKKSTFCRGTNTNILSLCCSTSFDVGTSKNEKFPSLNNFFLRLSIYIYGKTNNCACEVQLDVEREKKMGSTKK